MNTSTHPILNTLAALVGPAHVLTEDLQAWEIDWRRKYKGRALAVVRPGNTQEVAAVVKACVASGISIVPQGGNTSLVGGSTPDASGTQIILSLRRMDRVLALDPANLTLTAESGCILQNLQNTAEQQGFMFPLSLAAEGSCTLGGNLGTNAGGTQVLRYGNTRELCLGLEVVTAQGDIWNGLSGLRKDNTGYDLRHLFIGSEGTLGVITAASMKLVPMPAAQLSAWAAVPSLEAAVALLGLAHRQLGAGLTGFEVMGQFALSLVARHFPQQRVPLYTGAPFCVLLEHSDHESEAHARVQLEALLEAALNHGLVSDAVLAENLGQAKALWHVRESIPMAQVEEGPNIKHDISIAVSRIPEFVKVTDQLLRAAIPGVRLVNFGHLGDGNLHYNVQAPEGQDAAQFMLSHEDEVNTLVFDSVTGFGGSISAEHGVGFLKVDKLEKHKSPVALDMMRSIKRALDPHNLMNPGRVIRV